tara:strand:- start:698 stop:892 length:195 start_codon:yes stop_codon:yes gene_type:complete
MNQLTRIVRRLFSTIKRPLPYEIIEQEEKEIFNEFYKHPLVEKKEKTVYDVEKEEWMIENDRED